MRSLARTYLSWMISQKCTYEETGMLLLLHILTYLSYVPFDTSYITI